MSRDSDEAASSGPVNELSPEEAKRKREQLLARMAECAGDSGDAVDTADATLATLILPGG